MSTKGGKMPNSKKCFLNINGKGKTEYAISEHTSVGQLLQRGELGIAGTTVVELNGKKVELSHAIQDGESFNITTV